MTPSPILVCFAVKEEARSLGRVKKTDAWKILITGMGQANAAAGIRSALSKFTPRLVITAGFAGGLNPELAVGTVVFDVDESLEAGLGARLLKSGVFPAKIHCAECVAVTAAEKQVLWQLTGADIVEMESAVIRKICREKKIPSATIRVVSDAAAEDLPLDFNSLMTAAHRINYPKLAWKLVTQPGIIPKLMSFQKQTAFAALKLGEVLKPLLPPGH